MPLILALLLAAACWKLIGFILAWVAVVASLIAACCLFVVVVIILVAVLAGPAGNEDHRSSRRD